MHNLTNVQWPAALGYCIVLRFIVPLSPAAPGVT
jgi:hypothetical protein